MVNSSYQSKSIIAGVSTRPYALREDGHATDQENCFLSPKYGLAKRPGTTYLQTLEASKSVAHCLAFPLYSNDQQRLVIAFDALSWQVFGPDGNKSTVTHFPSSLDSTKTASNKYAAAGADLSPRDTTHTTIGDVTFVCDSKVIPKMKATTWAGYTDTVEDPENTSNSIAIVNDDVFCVDVKHLPTTTSTLTPMVFLTENNTAGVAEVFEASYAVAVGGTNLRLSGGGGNLHTRPSAGRGAAVLSYQISAFKNTLGHYVFQATSMDSTRYNSGSNTLGLDGTQTVMGRYIGSPRGTFLGASVSGDLAADLDISDTWGSVAWKSVDDVSGLPRLSWIDHTLKVGQQEEKGGFYMRFVSDAPEDLIFANNDSAGQGYDDSSPDPQVDSTTKLTRAGHWEEYCKVGAKQTIDGSTMPLLFVQRPDDSYALMEARGSFQVNSTDDDVSLLDADDTLVFVADGGFTNTAEISPLVVGDTIQFKGSFDDSDVTAAGKSLDDLPELETDYYIVAKAWDSGTSRWAYQISETEGGTVFVMDDGAVTHNSLEVHLTTYKTLDWTKRTAGDDLSNNIPAFIDNKITAMFNFQDRLGLVSEGEVVFSGTGDYFNFFRTTVRDLIDSDPFAVVPNTSSGDILKYAIPFDKEVLLVSNKAQFSLKAEGGLSPTTASSVRSSSISSDFFGIPTVVNENIFLAYEQEEFSGVYNLVKSRAVQDRYDSFDVSVNIPGYLPRGPRRMIGTEKHNMLFFLDDLENTKLYVYSWLDGSEGREHSAWTKWTFGSDYEILDIVIMVDRLYMVTKTNNMVCLEYIDLDLTSQDNLLATTVDVVGELQGNFDNVLIDHKTASYVNTTQSAAGVCSLSAYTTESDCTTNSGVWSSRVGGIYAVSLSSGDTLIDLKYVLSGNNKTSVVIVLANDTGTVYEYDTAGTAADGTITVTVVGPTTLSGHGENNGGTPGSQAMTRITLNGVNISTTKFYVGFKYDMISTYGPFLPTIENQSMGGRNIFVRGGRLTFSQAREFEIAVTHDTVYTQTVSSSSAKATKSGDTMFAVRKHLPDLAFTLTNKKPWNALFQILKYDISVQEVEGG